MVAIFLSSNLPTAQVTGGAVGKGDEPATQDPILTGKICTCQCKAGDSVELGVGTGCFNKLNGECGGTCGCIKNETVPFYRYAQAFVNTVARIFGQDGSKKYTADCG